MAERVGHARLGRDADRQVAPHQRVEAVVDLTAFLAQGIDVVDHLGGKGQPDGARDLEHQLGLWLEAIDATSDDALDRVGEGEGGEVLSGRDRAAPGVDLDHPAVAQRVGELFGEERVSTGLLGDQLGDGLGQVGDRESLASDLDRLARVKRGQRDPLGRRLGQELIELRGQPRAGAGREQDADGQLPAGQLLDERPGRRIEPVAVVDADQQRLGGSLGEHLQQEAPARQRAPFSLKCPALLRIGQLDPEDQVEQRREWAQRLGKGVDGTLGARRRLRALIGVEQRSEHAAPGVIRGDPLDRVAGTADAAPARGLGPPQRLQQQPRLAHPSLALEHDHLRLARGRQFDGLGQRVALAATSHGVTSDRRRARAPADGFKHSDRAHPSLELDIEARAPIDPLPRGPLGRGIAEHRHRARTGRDRAHHQPRRGVDHGAHHRVLAPSAVADRTTQGPAGRDADPGLPPIPGQDARHRHRRAHRAERIVVVRKRREPGGREHARPLGVDREVTDRRLAAVELALQLGHGSLDELWFCLVVDPREVHEHDRHGPQLGKPPALPDPLAAHDRGRDERRQ